MSIVFFASGFHIIQNGFLYDKILSKMEYKEDITIYNPSRPQKLFYFFTIDLQSFYDRSIINSKYESYVILTTCKVFKSLNNAVCVC